MYYNMYVFTTTYTLMCKKKERINVTKNSKWSKNLPIQLLTNDRVTFFDTI